MDSYPDFIIQLANWISSSWKIILIDTTSYRIFLGPLIIGIITFIVGWRLVRWFIVKYGRSLLKNTIKDNSTRVWFENFTALVMLILLFQIALIITGVPVRALGEIWGFTLFNIKDQHITVGNIFLGLLLLYPGIRFSRYVAEEFQTMFLTHLSLDLASKKSIEAILRYFLFVIVILFVLTIVGIPLSAFTLLGGAVAIGVGLGSQNLVNNFLSGLVLMAERPLKVGDIVELEGRKGTVEQIGGRSTRIRTFDNIRMVLPNSKLLENTVINWSLIDSKIRRELKLGITYGSDTQKARDILYRVIDEHPNIQRDPDPLIFFMDFGDSALMFSCFFWLEMADTLNSLRIESELRFRIDEEFRKAGIVIAFPQRDVHLDTTRPLEVNITEKTPGTGDRK